MPENWTNINLIYIFYKIYIKFLKTCSLKIQKGDHVDDSTRKLYAWIPQKRLDNNQYS